MDSHCSLMCNPQLRTVFKSSKITKIKLYGPTAAIWPVSNDRDHSDIECERNLGQIRTHIVDTEQVADITRFERLEKLREATMGDKGEMKTKEQSVPTPPNLTYYHASARSTLTRFVTGVYTPRRTHSRRSFTASLCRAQHKDEITALIAHFA
ncbi:hypothetical protein CBL_01244 [Carabus blaptoides fortunei]